jgi:hypothetical protein
MDDCRNFCREVGIPFSENGFPLLLRKFPFALSVAAPDKGLEVVGFANMLCEGPEKQSNHRSIFCMKSWGMWSSCFDEIGEYLFENLYPTPSSLEAAPACLFEHTDDSRELRAIVSLTTLFQWDGFFLRDQCGYSFFVSHERQVFVFCESEEVQANFLEYFKAWSPQKGISADHQRLFC